METRIPARYLALFEDGPDKSILFILLGGTVDAKPYRHTETYLANQEPPDIIKPLRHSRIPSHLIARGYDKHCYCVQKEMKDSQLVNDEDITDIAQTIAGSRHSKVALSCGTSDMTRIARELQGNLGELGVTGKTVIIFGAMEPLKHGRRVSDGYENIDFNVEALLQGKLKPGVYVGMRDRENTLRIFKTDDALRKVVEPAGRGYHRYFTGHTVNIDVAMPTAQLQGL